MKRIMVFAPHPDDDIIGCGGSIAKHIKQGNEVIIIYLTSGDSGSLNYTKDELSIIRENEAKNASKIIGIKEVIFLRNKDGYLEYNKENLIKIITLIRNKKPEIIYCPHELDAHKDHQNTSKLVIEATNRASGPWFQECEGNPWSVETILGYEIWTPLQNFLHTEDISEFIDIKLEALREHKSQIKNIQYDKAIKGLNRYRGIMTAKGKYCECFQVLRANKI